MKKQTKKWPQAKTFRLEELHMNDLQKIMENYGMATENEAVKYVIQQHTALVENLEKTNMALFTAEDELELIDGKLNDLRRGLYWVLSKTGKYHDEEE